MRSQRSYRSWNALKQAKRSCGTNQQLSTIEYELSVSKRARKPKGWRHIHVGEYPRNFYTNSVILTAVHGGTPKFQRSFNWLLTRSRAINRMDSTLANVSTRRSNRCKFQANARTRKISSNKGRSISRKAAVYGRVERKEVRIERESRIGRRKEEEEEERAHCFCGRIPCIS